MNSPTMNGAGPEAALLFLHALTSLHPGSGTALGTVDLPVQRERHTQWPIIPGSSLKGVLRETCRPPAEGEARQTWLAVFGPETNANEDGHAGAVSLTDARILAFPVRSLKGVFAWVTCPAVLQRLHRDLQLSPELVRTCPLVLPSDPGREKVLCPPDSPLLVEKTRLVLEEFEFLKSKDDGSAANWVALHAVRDEPTRVRIRANLVVLHDDDFTHFVCHATEIVARIGLDYERKTVKQGALFYQECLPAETLFYSVVLANSSRRKDCSLSAMQVRDYVKARLDQVRILQVGGDETTGKGICAVRLSDRKEGAG